MTDALVVGAGPAGLMAAEVLAQAGLQVTVADHMPTPARKFLMAGKSGLNLTKDEPPEVFEAAYPDAPPALQQALRAFGPTEVQGWATGLGQPVFAGSSGRVFPKAMKASPLLRAWLARLSDLGVVLRTRWRWQHHDAGAHAFETPEGSATLTPRIAILAMGGASWQRLGSDGTWADHFETAPFAPSNMGLRVDWSRHMDRHFGAPLKAVTLQDGTRRKAGECVISSKGLEGSLVYDFSAAIRAGRSLTLDLKPSLTSDQIRARLDRVPVKTSRSNALRKAVKLSPQAIAIFQEWGDRHAPLETALKSVPVRGQGPAPLDQAISTVGGLRMGPLDGFRIAPGLFAAGEMLDWDAPTGGYLITACLATGRAAARQALDELL